MIISKTPLRISFAGGGTDLPSFCANHEYGAVLSTSIDSYIYVIVKKHTHLFNERIRLNYSDVELVNHVDDIENSIIRECMKFLEMDERLYISTIADSPASSGLGSSSSFCVGLLNALYKYRGISTSTGRLAEEAAHIEMERLKRPIGKQDHYAAAYGGLNHFRFNANGTVIIHPVFVSNQKINMIFDNMLSFWTGMTRPAESVLSEQDRRNHENTEVLIKMRNQAHELVNILLDSGSTINDFASVIHEGWEMKRKLASGVSNDRINQLYDIARKNGAIGGKISGAGGGGFLNLFAEKKDHQSIVESLKKEGLIYFRFNSASLGSMVTQLG